MSDKTKGPLEGLDAKIEHKLSEPREYLEIKAFPHYGLDQLFYLALEARAANIDEGNPVTRHHHMVEKYNNHH